MYNIRIAHPQKMNFQSYAVLSSKRHKSSHFSALKAIKINTKTALFDKETCVCCKNG